MQERTTNLSLHDRAILCRYADFRLNDQMQSLRLQDAEMAKRDGAFLFSTVSGKKVLARKKQIL